MWCAENLFQFKGLHCLQGKCILVNGAGMLFSGKIDEREGRGMEVFLLLISFTRWKQHGHQSLYATICLLCNTSLASIKSLGFQFHLSTDWYNQPLPLMPTTCKLNQNHQLVFLMTGINWRIYFLGVALFQEVFEAKQTFPVCRHYNL